MLDWAAAAVGDHASVRAVRALHGEQGPWRLELRVSGRREYAVLRAPTPRIDASMIATGAAALEVAGEHGVPAPRLLAADLDGRVAGAPATLETVVAGSTVWPRTASGDRLRAAGAVLARVHAVPLEPRPHLPLRVRPIAVDDFAGERREGRMATSPLLRAADEVIRGRDRPVGATVFVHGDVWPGNLAWTDGAGGADGAGGVGGAGGAVGTLIDWKTAGVGDPGVDIGELRKQMALTYGPGAIGDVVAGWEAVAGVRAADVAYWDAVAALNTPTDLGPVGTPRRDAFLRSALDRLVGD